MAFEIAEIALAKEQPKVLLVEDNSELRREYSESLKQAGFEVFEIDDGKNLISRTLGDVDGIEVVLCDTEMKRLNGPEACREIAGSGGLLEGKLLIGMSDNPEHQDAWRGLAHHFYSKKYLLGEKVVWDIGEQVKSHLYNFIALGGIWRQVMPALKKQDSNMGFVDYNG